MANECGTCTLCCKLVEVEDLQKPAGRWCGFCSSGQIYPAHKGCQIHDQPQQPAACKRFRCLWLAGDWPVDLRPDRSGVVFLGGPDKLIQARYESTDYPFSLGMAAVVAELQRQGYTVEWVAVKRRGNR
jgi:hypothetical protein